MVHCNVNVYSVNTCVSFQAAEVDTTTVLITVMGATAVSCHQWCLCVSSGILLMAFILQAMEEALAVIMGVTEGITKVITRVAAAEAMEEETVMTTVAIVCVVVSQLFKKWSMDVAELSDVCLQITVAVEETATTWATTNPSRPTLVR